jgi:hypothetical protein
MYHIPEHTHTKKNSAHSPFVRQAKKSRKILITNGDYVPSSEMSVQNSTGILLHLHTFISFLPSQYSFSIPSIFPTYHRSFSPFILSTYLLKSHPSPHLFLSCNLFLPLYLFFFSPYLFPSPFILQSYRHSSPHAFPLLYVKAVPLLLLSILLTFPPPSFAPFLYLKTV